MKICPDLHCKKQMKKEEIIREEVRRTVFLHEDKIHADKIHKRVKYDLISSSGVWYFHSIGSVVGSKNS